MPIAFALSEPVFQTGCNCLVFVGIDREQLKWPTSSAKWETVGVTTISTPSGARMRRNSDAFLGAKHAQYRLRRTV